MLLDGVRMSRRPLRYEIFAGLMIFYGNAFMDTVYREHKFVFHVDFDTDERIHPGSYWMVLE